jgi:DNA (cytosine-5)-methyltransferase 1
MYNHHMDNKFITIKEASSLLGVSKLTLRNWDNSKKLVSYRNPINNYRLYKKQDILNFINQIEINKGLKVRKKLSPPATYKLKVLHIKD